MKPSLAGNKQLSIQFAEETGFTYLMVLREPKTVGQNTETMKGYYQQ
jgi:hypothetical protein